MRFKDWMSDGPGFTPLKNCLTPACRTGRAEKKFPGNFRDKGFQKTDRGLKNVRKYNSLTGFTLIELMLVVIIIGALAAMILPRLAGRSEQAKAAIAKTDVTANIPVALDLFEIDNGRYPTTEEGLKSLVQQPGGLKDWKGPYAKKKKFLDPWGKEYQYRCPSSQGMDYDLFSFGADGVQSRDDVTNWEE